jgi:hypothetical protein
LPVLVKGHPAHPATVGAVRRGGAGRPLRAAGAPDGTFSLLQGRSAEVGRGTGARARGQAVGFTGSTEVGRALFDLAAGRPEPIPVYAEMGSINPVFLTPGALAERGSAIAEGLAGSMTLSTGQFCTSPGLGRGAGRRGRPGVRRTPHRTAAGGPCGADAHLGDPRRPAPALSRTSELDGVEVLVGGGDESAEGTTTAPTLLRVDWATFAATPEMLAEHFGPAALVVSTPPERYADRGPAPGGEPHRHRARHRRRSLVAGELQSVLARRPVGIVWNGFPTGVAVTAAQHHGGPYPATTAPAHTSVGVPRSSASCAPWPSRTRRRRCCRPSCRTTTRSAAPSGERRRDAGRRVSAPALWRVQVTGGVRFAAGAPDEGPQHLLPESVDLDELLATGGSALRDAVKAPTPEPVPVDARVLCPLQGQEVWAAGVTFERSRTARNEEAGPVDFYDRVYAADRPELFGKAAVGRSRGPEEPVAVRADSGWDVPEPELGVVADAAGRIVAYTVGNDMSSRSIEGENPLYLPQAKVYEGSCSVGPCLLPVEDARPPAELTSPCRSSGTAPSSTPTRCRCDDAPRARRAGRLARSVARTSPSASCS